MSKRHCNRAAGEDAKVEREENENTTRIEQFRTSNRISEVIVTPPRAAHSYTMTNREGKQPFGTTQMSPGLSVPNFFKLRVWPLDPGAGDHTFGSSARYFASSAGQTVELGLARWRYSPRCRATEVSAFLSQFSLGELTDLREFTRASRTPTTSSPPISAATSDGIRAADSTQLPFYLQLMRHLARKGLPVPEPQPTRCGALVAELKGKAGGA